jgi:hypothetical protein
VHLDIELLEPETGRQPALQFYGFEEMEFEIRDGMATHAD